MSQQERVSLIPAMAGCVGLSTACNTCRGVLHQMHLALLGAAGEYTCTCYNVGPSRRPGLLLLCTILCSPLSLTTPVVAPANLHRFGFCEVSWKAAVGAAGTMTALYAGINLEERKLEKKEKKCCYLDKEQCNRSTTFSYCFIVCTPRGVSRTLPTKLRNRSHIYMKITSV